MRSQHPSQEIAHHHAQSNDLCGGDGGVDDEHKLSLKPVALWLCGDENQGSEEERKTHSSGTPDCQSESFCDGVTEVFYAQNDVILGVIVLRGWDGGAVGVA